MLQEPKEFAERVVSDNDVSRVVRRYSDAELQASSILILGIFSVCFAASAGVLWLDAGAMMIAVITAVSFAVSGGIVKVSYDRRADAVRGMAADLSGPMMSARIEEMFRMSPGDFAATVARPEITDRVREEFEKRAESVVIVSARPMTSARN